MYCGLETYLFYILHQKKVYISFWQRKGDNRDSDKVNIKVLPPSFHIPLQNKEDSQFNSKRKFQSKNVYQRFSKS